MYGLEAITAHNGWAQALTGAIIVMSGLTILSIVISLLPKLVALIERKKAPSPAAPRQAQAPQAPAIETPTEVNLQNICTAAKNCAALSEPLGDAFQLEDLYRFFNEKDIPHPHITIKSFREAGLISPIGDGQFTWKLSSE